MILYEMMLPAAVTFRASGIHLKNDRVISQTFANPSIQPLRIPIKALQDS
jgi:hypothetical protein